MPSLLNDIAVLSSENAYGPPAVELQHRRGQLIRVVAGKVAPLRGQGPLRQLQAQGGDPLPVHHQGGGVLRPVALQQSGPHRGGVGQAQVHPGPVGHQGLHMVGGSVALRLPVLGHDIAHIDLQGVRLPDSLGHPLHQQVGDDAGVQAPRPQQQQVGI